MERAIIVLSFISSASLRLYFGETFSNFEVYRSVLFVGIYAYTYSLSKTCKRALLMALVSKCIGYAIWHTHSIYIGIAFLCFQRARLHRTLSTHTVDTEFVVVDGQPLTSIGSNYVYGLAHYTARAELTWFIIGHAVFGFYGIPALLLLVTTPVSVSDDYALYLNTAKLRLHRQIKI